MKICANLLEYFGKNSFLCNLTLGEDEIIHIKSKEEEGLDDSEDEEYRRDDDFNDGNIGSKFSVFYCETYQFKDIIKFHE